MTSRTRFAPQSGSRTHQRISAVHNDKDHFHFHVAINKVHPQTFKTITPYFDQPRLQAACIELEKKHGLTPTNHQMPERGQNKLKGRAEAMELQGKQQSLIQWVRDEAGPALLKAQEAGHGWQDLHKAAASYGLEIKSRGAGLVIAMAGDKYARVKPSEIDRRLSFGALTRKWGAFQEPRGPQPAPKWVYPRAPVLTRSPATAELFKEFQRDRQRALEERKAGRETRREGATIWRKKMVGWAAERRAAIKAMPFTAEGRQEAYAALKRDKMLAAEREKARLADDRRQAEARALPTWQSWLRDQAARGNTVAAEVLRSTDQRKAELGAAVLSAENADQARHVVYQHLRPAVGRNGEITYRVADGGRVTDQARQVRVDEVSVAASFLALNLAADRFGDRPLAVAGTDAFKAQIAAMAAMEGVNVTFADPAMEAERQHQVKEHQARQPAAPPAGGPEKADPPLVAFVNRRNAARASVPDILPHRAWTPADAGDATYQGRRQIGEGWEVLLFDRDGETLVKPVSAAQAARASTWHVGDSVQVDERGRLHDDQHQQVRPSEPGR